MKYYAGAVRSPGTKTDNQDAVMIKGFKLFRKNVVVMLAASVDSRSLRNIMPVRILPKLLSQKLVTKLERRNARQTDAIVRSAERRIDEMILCGTLGNLTIQGKQELVTSCGKKWKSINISLLVLAGKDYYVWETTGESLIHITSTGVDTLRKRGRLNEGSTILALTDNAKKRMTEKEMWELFAPQMCIYEGYIDEALREMADLVRRKGDDLPLTAAGVCIK